MKLRAVFFPILIVLAIPYALSASDYVLNSSQTVLSSNIPLNPAFQNLIGSILGTGSALSVQSGILALVLFLVIFFVISSVISLVPFFEGRASRITASIIITLLAAFGGGIRSMLIFLSGLSNIFGSLGDFSGSSIIIPLAVLVFISIIVAVVTKGLRTLFSKEEAYAAGSKIGRDIAESKAYGKIFKKSLS